MNVKQEIMDIIQKVWTKLQALPQAKPLEIGTFTVVILFMGQYMPLFSCLFNLFVGDSTINHKEMYSLLEKCPFLLQVAFIVNIEIQRKA